MSREDDCWPNGRFLLALGALIYIFDMASSSLYKEDIQYDVLVIDNLSFIGNCKFRSNS